MIGSLDGPSRDAWPSLVRCTADHKGTFAGCDPALVFELADGALGPEEARLARRHLESCGECRGLYERERSLSSRLGAPLKSVDFAPAPSGRCPAHQAVAMALPTRHPVVRLLWAGLAGALFVSAVVLIGRYGAAVLMPTVGSLAALWGTVSGGAQLARGVFVAVGPALLVILALGALVDLIVASCAVLITRRAWARRRPGRT